jgi:hypothetical protein
MTLFRFQLLSLIQHRSTNRPNVVDLAKDPCDGVDLAKDPCDGVDLAKDPCDGVDLAKDP